MRSIPGEGGFGFGFFSGGGEFSSCGEFGDDGEPSWNKARSASDDSVQSAILSSMNNMYTHSQFPIHCT